MTTGGKMKMQKTAHGHLFHAAAAACCLLLFLQLSHAQGDCSGECTHQYLQEPPSDIDCNPWATSAGLRVRCQASVPASPDTTAEIHWFFNSERIISSFSPLEGIEVAPNTVENGQTIITSTLALELNEENSQYAGNYYCRILVNSNYTACQSGVLQLQDQSPYITFPLCNPNDDRDIQFEPSTRCAGNPTVPTPTTTTPTTPTSPMTTSATPLSTSTDEETSSNDRSPSTSDPDGSTRTNSTDDPTTTPTPPSTTLRSTEEAQGPPLQVWVYVLVAVAAVFGMIIVVLTILCVGLCLKKNKTEDTYKQKDVDIRQFTSNSMVSNGLYQRKDDGGITSGTHNTAHSQISDYNMLGERDYEVIDVGPDKHDYHHLQRPSPPMLPNGGRNATFNFAPSKEFQSMSTLTSQQGGRAGGDGVFQHTPPTNGFFSHRCSSEGPDDHVYHGLEPSHGGHGGMPRPVRDIYRSPTSSDSPEVFGRGGTMPNMDMSITTPTTITTTMGYNESLYSPNFDSPPQRGNTIGVQQGGLENVPETGSMFSEPANPTAFPVHNYEKITTKEYETPIITRKKNGSSIETPPTTATTMAGSAPSTSLCRSSGSTSTKANTGPRYETEVPTQQSAVEEESQYSKLIRPSVDTFANTMPQNYSELSLGNDEEGVVVKTQLDRGLFPHNTSKHEAGGAARRAMPDNHQPDKSFTLPSHMAPGNGRDVPSSKNPIAIANMSSPTDSLSSYIAQLEESSGNPSLPTDSQMEEILFSSTAPAVPQETNTLNHLAETAQHSNSSSQRNGSVGSREAARVPALSARGPPKRAWSEERGMGGDNKLTTSQTMAEKDNGGGMMKNRFAGFSSSTMGNLNGQTRHHVVVPPQATASALHKDLRPNGLDSRIPEFARSRTMV